MGRLHLQMSRFDIVLSMSGGNPGAIAIVSKILERRDIAILLICDIYGLYGSDLYMLFNDCCDCNYELTRLTLMRCHNAHVTPGTLLTLVRGDGRGVPVAAWPPFEVLSSGAASARSTCYESISNEADETCTINITHIAAP